MGRTSTDHSDRDPACSARRYGTATVTIFRSTNRRVLRVISTARRRASTAGRQTPGAILDYARRMQATIPTPNVTAALDRVCTELALPPAVRDVQQIAGRSPHGQLRDGVLLWRPTSRGVHGHGRGTTVRDNATGRSTAQGRTDRAARVEPTPPVLRRKPPNLLDARRNTCKSNSSSN